MTYQIDKTDYGYHVSAYNGDIYSLPKDKVIDSLKSIHSKIIDSIYVSSDKPFVYYFSDLVSALRYDEIPQLDDFNIKYRVTFSNELILLLVNEQKLIIGSQFKKENYTWN